MLKLHRLAALVLIVFSTFAISRILVAEEYGGIEIGSTGIKRVVIDFPQTGPSRDATGDSSINVALESGLDADKTQFKKEVLDEAIEVITKHRESLMNGPKRIPTKRIFIAISSGLSKAAGKQALLGLIQEINKVHKDNVVEVLDEKKEAELTFEGVVTEKSKQSTSIVIDVGGGNTKIATKSGKGAVQFGASSFTKEREAGVEKANELAKGKLASLLSVANFPELPTVSHIYLSGGSAYITASLIKPKQIGENNLSDTPISSAELESQVKAIADAKDLNKMFADLMSQKENQDDGTRKNLQNAEKIYNLEKLQSGSWLLEAAVKSVVGMPGREASSPPTITFHGDGQTAWIRALLVRKAREAEGNGPALKKDFETLKEEVNVDIKNAQREMQRALSGFSSQIVDSQKKLADGFDSATARLAPLDQIKSIDGRVSELSGQLKTGLANSPTRQDLKELEKNINQKLDRIAAVLENRPPPPDRAASHENAAYFYGQGVESARDHKWERARSQFAVSIEHEATNPSAWYFLAICNLMLGDEAAAKSPIAMTADLIGSEPSLYAHVCRAAENVQGPVRQRAERLLLEARSTRHVTSSTR